jgi:hypothetical protein
MRDPPRLQRATIVSHPCVRVYSPPPPAHRQHDAENAIWVGQLRQPLRLRILALRAFNLETLLIGEAVKSKESAVMQIRCVCLPPQRAQCAKGAAAWVMLQACWTCSMSFSPHSCWAPLPPCLTPAGRRCRPTLPHVVLHASSPSQVPVVA